MDGLSKPIGFGLELVLFKGDTLAQELLRSPFEPLDKMTRKAKPTSQENRDDRKTVSGKNNVLESN